MAPPTNPRTAVIDAILTDIRPDFDAEEVDAIAEVNARATEGAIRNSHPLANWATYRHSDLWPTEGPA